MSHVYLKFLPTNKLLGLDKCLREAMPQWISHFSRYCSNDAPRCTFNAPFAFLEHHGKASSMTRVIYIHMGKVEATSTPGSKISVKQKSSAWEEMAMKKNTGKTSKVFWSNCQQASFIHLPHRALKPWPTHMGSGCDQTQMEDLQHPPIAQWEIVLRVWQRWIVYAKLSRVVYLILHSPSSLLFFLLPDKINHSFFWASHTQSYIPPVQHLSQWLLVIDTSVFSVTKLLESRNYVFLILVLWMVAWRLI